MASRSTTSRKRRQRNPPEDLPYTAKRSHLDDTGSVWQQAEPHYIITARMPINALTTRWSLGENRQIDTRQVQRLCSIFKKGGLKRNAKENRVLVLCSVQEVSMMKQHLNLDEAATASLLGETLFFKDWLHIHGGRQAEVMAGQHRLKALESYVQQMKWGDEELWWQCDFYNRDTLPDNLNLQLRLNRKDPTLVDSHGQIWAQIMAASDKNDRLLREEKCDVLKHEITSTLQLSSDVNFPMSRLVTVWRNERWREMTNQWCETTVGRDTFKISTWHWMISIRIDDYWFSTFRSVIYTLSQLHTHASKKITGDDWEWMARALPPHRTEQDVRGLFYPGRGPEQPQQAARRQPKLLTALDDDAYSEVCTRILKTPQLRFANVHRLLSLSQSEGAVLFQVMGHIISWLNPNPTVVADSRDNKKPALRNDLVPQLQHCSPHFIRLAQKAADMGPWEMPAESPAEMGSILLQQEILDFTRARLKAFKEPTMKAFLQRPLQGDNDGHYATRFRDSEVWLGLLKIVRRYQGASFRPGWTLSNATMQSAEEEPSEAAFEQARDLSKFLKRIPRLYESSLLNSSTFNTALAQWFSQQERLSRIDSNKGEDDATARDQSVAASRHQQPHENKATEMKIDCNEQLTSPSPDLAGETVGEMMVKTKQAPFRSSHQISSPTRVDDFDLFEHETGVDPAMDSDNDDDLDDQLHVEAVDESFLGTSDTGIKEGGENLIGNSEEFKINHSTGSRKMTPENFILRTSEPTFSAADALKMFQLRYTMNYGGRKSGSRPADPTKEYYPSFHLDMISIVGRPLHPITNRSGFFDNVVFTLQRWQAPYSSKHAATSLSFDLTGRTFRLATGASREIWFLVMHPIEGEVVGRHAGGAESHPRQRKVSHQGSALQRHHAEVIASYILEDIFRDGELLGEGVEPSWKLNGRQSQTLSYDKWTRFQGLFMEQWEEFTRRNLHDTFWRTHQPAFHVYDHGANIEIEVNGALETLPRETPIRSMNEDDISDSDSEIDNNDNDNGDNSSDSDEEHNDAHRRQSPWGGEDRAIPSGEDTTSEEIGHPPALYSDGLKQLHAELEQKYNLDHVDQVSYALAVDINSSHSSGPAESSQIDGSGPQTGETICLLADRNKIVTEYHGPRDFAFYPLAFHPRYGNFSSSRPPRFLHNLCTIMQDNLCVQNEEAQVLSFGFFQGYSNIKRSIRSRPDELLATRGFATAALTLPPSEARQGGPRVQAKQQQLLRRLRGELTPDRPIASTPFAREGQRIRAAIEQHQLSFRMEQVVTVKVARLIPQNRNFFTVLQPIFQLMRFFIQETESYTDILRSFRPSIFPNVLCSFARLFELALGEMERRFRKSDGQGLGLALSEGIAALDRLGHYCFTGDPRVLPKTVLDPLMTMESIRQGAWPFISPDMLTFGDSHGSMNTARWPRMLNQQPILLHVAALAYHYGAVVATHRHSQIWFGQLRGQGLRNAGDAVRFLEDIFRNLWIPQMMLFMANQLRRMLSRGARSVEGDAEERQRALQRFTSVLEAWEKREEPFSNQQYNTLVSAVPDNQPAGAALKSISKRARYDFAREIYEVCCSAEVSAGRAISSTHATWISVLRGAIQQTGESDVTRIEWIAGIETAIAATGIEWMPGSRGQKLTSRHVVQLVGQAKARRGPTAAPGSLKRAAPMTGLEMTGDERRAKRAAQRRVIDFGCSIPFIRIPGRISAGFSKLEKQTRGRDMSVVNHYQLARNCLMQSLGDPLCDLIILLTLTMASSTETPQAKGRMQGFSTGKKKDPDILAANMVTRMLWYLRPKVFPWNKDDRGILCIKEMTKKVEQTHINNAFMRELGWIQAKGNREHPRTMDCTLTSEDELYTRRKKLMALRRKPEAFIAHVFYSDDRIWVDRCGSIIKEYRRAS